LEKLVSENNVDISCFYSCDTGKAILDEVVGGTSPLNGRQLELSMKSKVFRYTFAEKPTESRIAIITILLCNSLQMPLVNYLK
jgi:hypothetical protein